MILKLSIRDLTVYLKSQAGMGHTVGLGRLL